MKRNRRHREVPVPTGVSNIKIYSQGDYTMKNKSITELTNLILEQGEMITRKNEYLKHAHHVQWHPF